jgi:hypothetical protein
VVKKGLHGNARALEHQGTAHYFGVLGKHGGQTEDRGQVYRMSGF